MDICNLCHGKQLQELLDFGKHPIAHHFLKSYSENQEVYHVNMKFCENCGLIQLVNPIAANTLYANYTYLTSRKHQPQIPKLIELIKKYSGLKKTALILEVGSNDGIFLEALKNQGYRNLIGIDPALDASCAAQQKGIKTINSYFTKESAGEFVSSFGKCDLFISRHMLEHVPDLVAFQEAMRIVLHPDAHVLFEVPDFGTNLNLLDYGVWEEHVNQFTLQSFSFFLANIGVSDIHDETMLFSGNSLIFFGKYTNGVKVKQDIDMQLLRAQILRYKNKWAVFRSAFSEYLCRHKKSGGRIAVYGASVRVCSLINFSGIGLYLEFVVDDQSEKQGKYMPGSRLLILPSTAIQENSITLCLLAVNAECENKVIAKHQEFIRKGGQFVSVLPPSGRLPAFWNNINDL